MAWFNHGDMRIHFEESGSGDPLLLLPGGAAPSMSSRDCARH
jgi:hypothetical protein